MTAPKFGLVVTRHTIDGALYVELVQTDVKRWRWLLMIAKMALNCFYRLSRRGHLAGYCIGGVTILRTHSYWDLHKNIHSENITPLIITIVNQNPYVQRIAMGCMLLGTYVWR